MANRNMNVWKMMVKGEVLFVFLSMLCWQLQAASAATPKTALPCLYTERPPVIDGVLDDACWRDCGRAVDFLVLNIYQVKVIKATQALVRHDKENLYLGFLCEEPEPDKLKAGGSEEDRGRVFSDDSIEIFLDVNSDRKTYFHIGANSKGIYDDGNVRDKSWDADMEVAAKVNADCWVVEMRIPFSELDLSTPRDDTVWRVNFNRTDRVSQPRQATSWADLGISRSYHSPRKFGHMQFLHKPDRGQSRRASHFDYERQANLIKNSGFDLTSDRAGRPDSWAAAGAGELWVIEGPEHSTDFRLAIDKDSHPATQKLDVSGIAGQKFFVSANIKGDSGAKGTVELTYQLKTGETQSCAPITDKAGDGVYRHFEGAFTFPENAERLTALNLKQSNNKGPVYFNNVVLTKDDLFKKLVILKYEYYSIHQEPAGPPPEFPHIKWARPYHGRRKIKVLCITNKYWDFHSRPILTELSRRFPIEADSLLLDFSGDILLTRDPDKVRDRLRHGGYDVLVSDLCVRKEFFEKEGAFIKQLVTEEGLGVVFFNQTFGFDAEVRDREVICRDGLLQERHPVANGLPWKQMCPSDTKFGPFGLDALSVGKAGKGNFVAIEYKTKRSEGLLPQSEDCSWWLARNTGRPGYNLKTTHYDLNFDYWEYYYSLLGKCFFQAAGIVPEVTLDFNAGSEMIQAGEDATLKVTLASATNQNVNIAASYKNDGKPEYEPFTKSLSISGGKPETVTIPVPPESGRHFIDVWVKDEAGEIINWGSACRVVEPTIELTCQPDKEYYQRNQPVALTITTDTDAAMEKVCLALDMKDVFGRQMFRRAENIDLAPGKKSLTRRFTPGRLLAELAYLEVSLSRGDRTLQRKTRRIYFPKNPREHLNDLLFSTFIVKHHQSYLKPHIWEIFRDVGFNAVSAWGRNDAGRGALEAGMPFIEQGGPSVEDAEKGMLFRGSMNHNGRVKDRKRKGWPPIDTKNWTRFPCLSDPGIIKIIKDVYRGFPGKYWQHPFIACMTPDESDIAHHKQEVGAEYCRSKFCRARYLKWLRATYGTLQALNAEWGTQYVAWDAVHIPFLTEARQGKNFAPWIDFRLFMDQVYADNFKVCKEALHSSYPEALLCTGSLTGGMLPYRGWDFYSILQNVQGGSLYPSDSFNRHCGLGFPYKCNHEAVRSFSKGDEFFTGWIGYAYQPPNTEFQAWWPVLHGLRGISWFCPTYSGQRGAVCSEVYGKTASTDHIKSVYRDLVQGVGKLILDQSRVQPQLAMLYSQASMYGAWCESSEPKTICPALARPNLEADSFVNYYRSRANFIDLVEDSQLQFDYVAPEQIAAQDKLENYKALVLPFSICMSEKTLAMAEAFALDGGVLIADFRTARLDGHGKPYADSLWLNRLFGARRTKVDCSYRITDKEGKPLTATFVANYENIRLTGKRIPVTGQEQIEATDGTVLARHENGTPAVVVKEHGKGFAVFFNFIPGFLPNKDATFKTFFNQILASAGLTRPVLVSASGGRAVPLDDFEAIRYPQENSSGEFVAVLYDWRNKERPRDVRIAFNGPMHVYDVRNRKYFGETDVVSAHFTPARANIYARLPYQVEKVRLDLDQRSYRQGETVKLAANLETSYNKPAGDHVFRVEVYNPDNELIRHYTKNVSATKGAYAGEVPLALNDAVGNWRIKVRDIVTGIETETRFEVEGQR